MDPAVIAHRRATPSPDERRDADTQLGVRRATGAGCVHGTRPEGVDLGVLKAPVARSYVALSGRS